MSNPWPGYDPAPSNLPPPPPPGPPGPPGYGGMPPQPPKRGFPAWAIVALIAVVVLLLGGTGTGAYFFFSGSGDDDPDASDTSGTGDEETGDEETGGEETADSDDEDTEGLPPTDEPITIGIANEQPYGYRDKNGEVTGFGPDVARAVLEEMGYGEFEFKLVQFGQLIPGLQAEQFDLVAAGMYITPERMEQILFSDPDYCTSESLAVLEGNPEGIVDYSSFVDNPDLTLAVAKGAVQVDYAEAAGIPAEQIEEYDGLYQMYQGLKSGEVDAVPGTASSVTKHVAARSGIESVAPFFPKDAEGNEALPCGAHGFSPDDQEFRDAFNEQLNQFREDGTTADIITSYEGFTDADVDMANQLTVDDFAK